mmetsp:Transcript_11745/g.33057  ORF Transcript_11745/g.33057 Transcript_11745/m.33057 type:complete len:396 (-) Transcript_11745:7081-8268(-)
MASRAAFAALYAAWSPRPTTAESEEYSANKPRFAPARACRFKAPVTLPAATAATSSAVSCASFTSSPITPAACTTPVTVAPDASRSANKPSTEDASATSHRRTSSAPAPKRARRVSRCPSSRTFPPRESSTTHFAPTESSDSAATRPRDPVPPETTTVSWRASSKAPATRGAAGTKRGVPQAPTSSSHSSSSAMSTGTSPRTRSCQSARGVPTRTIRVSGYSRRAVRARPATMPALAASTTVVDGTREDAVTRITGPPPAPAALRIASTARRVAVSQGPVQRAARTYPFWAYFCRSASSCFASPTACSSPAQLRRRPLCGSWLRKNHDVAFVFSPSSDTASHRVVSAGTAAACCFLSSRVFRPATSHTVSPPQPSANDPSPVVVASSCRSAPRRP